MRDNTSLTSAVFSTIASPGISAVLLVLMAIFIVASAIYGPAAPTDAHADQWLVFFPQGTGLTGPLANPLFKGLCVALFINLVFGVTGNLRKSSLSGLKPTHCLPLTQSKTEAEADVRRAFEQEFGFHGGLQSGNWVVWQKGLPQKYLTWALHLAIAACLLGLALTYLFSYEREITLTAGRPIALEQAVDGNLDVMLLSGPFTAAYTETPASRYPGSPLSRLTSFWKDERPVYEARGDAIYPVDWRLKVTITKAGAIVTDGFMDPGEPLSYDGLTFYLDGLDQTFRLRVDNNPLTLTVRNDNELVIPGLNLPVRFTLFKQGTVEKAGERAEPVAGVTRMTLSGPGEELGHMELGGTVYINGTRLTLVDVKEQAHLRYRHDPGAWLLKVGWLLIIATALVRLFGFWQQAAVMIEATSPVVRLHLNIQSKGLFTSTKRLYRRVESIMTENDIRPIPIAGERLK